MGTTKDIGRMEKKMETTRDYRGYIRYIGVIYHSVSCQETLS